MDTFIHESGPLGKKTSAKIGGKGKMGTSRSKEGGGDKLEKVTNKEGEMTQHVGSAVVGL